MQTTTVVITGCTRGLGHAMVPVFIEAGWQVAGCGRDESQIATLRQQVLPPHLFELCDVSREDDGADTRTTVLKTFDAPDLELNNAATAKSSPLSQTPSRDCG